MFKKITLISILALLLILGTYFNATKINTKQINVRQEILKSNKIDKDLDGLLIVYFSDLDYGKFIDNNYLKQVIDKINAFKPDIIIFGGNLIEQNIEQEYLQEALNSLNAKYGKYAVLGDNDGQLVQEILSKASFDIIQNNNRNIMIDKNSYINLIGINNLVVGNPDPNQAFLGVNAGHYSLVVSHCPDIFDNILNHEFDYMLAGHSHGGQIYIPLISYFNRPEGCKKYYRGKTFKNNKTLDITNGLGRINHNARLLADAEIVLYTLKSSE